MILTGELAQQIVNRAMTLVPHNVNIMDDKGIIIGTGQSHRLGTFHKGAMDVIQGNRIIAIYPNELDRYPGSLPGVNWPIVFEDQIIGVVGVSGHPKEVQDTAKLVTAVTELIIDRETLREEIRFHQQLWEQFAFQLLAETAAANKDNLTRMAKMLNFNLNLPRFVCVADFTPLMEDAKKNYGQHDFIVARMREKLLESLKESGLIADEDMPVLLENRLIIVKNHQPSQNLEQWGLRLARLFAATGSLTPLRIGIGSVAASFAHLHLSYNEALFALSSTGPSDTVNTIYQFDILAEYIISLAAKRSECQALTDMYCRTVPKLERKYDMGNTVRTLLDNNLNISATAKALYIHRNTLTFRLEKLKETTGLEPSRFLNHALLCKLLYSNVRP